MLPTIRPHLWYHRDALGAAEFYTSLLPDSHIDNVVRAGAGIPDVEEGDPFVVEFTLIGMRVAALAAGPAVTINEGFSFMLEVDTQEEVDRYWDALTADGGEPGPCGWCKDRWGVSWQVVPRAVNDLTLGTDEASARARDAMFRMQKLDIATLQAAYDGA